MKNACLIFLSLLLVCSCKVQKRKFRDGFYVDWFGGKNHQSATIKKQSHQTLQVATANETVLLSPASGDTELSAENSRAMTPVKKNTVLITKAPEDSCDVIIFRDGTEVRAKVREINGGDIKYNRCEMPDGPDYITTKSNVFMIKFSNGTREVMEAAQPKITNNQPPSSRQKPNGVRKEMNVFAVLSFIFGAIGLIIGFGILGIIFGNIALKQMEKEPDRYRGESLARIGKMLGLIKLGIIIGLLALYLLAFVLFI